jgi:hypothetical protein
VRGFYLTDRETRKGVLRHVFFNCSKLKEETTMYTLPYSCFTHEELEALSGVNDRDLLDTLRDFFEADTDGDLPYVAAEKPWNM